MNFYKRFFLLLTFSSFCMLFSQQKMKDYSKIMRSTNIYEIDAYLRDAHPDDPKRLILKPRLIKMLKEYIKNAHPADQRVKEFQEKIALLRKKPSTRITFDEMNDLIRQKQIAKFKEELLKKEGGTTYVTKSYGTASNPNVAAVNSATGLTASGMTADEEAEFNMLMNVNPTEHKNNTVKVLNSLFDNDPNSKESIVMIENKSDCNMIMRIEGVGNTKYRLAIPSHSDNTVVVTKGDYLFSSLVCGAQYASQKTVQKAAMVSLGEGKGK